MKNDFYVSTDKSMLDTGMIFDFLSNRSYWAAGRSRQAVESSILNSLCFGVFDRRGGQVGFARVVTDYAVFAWILDVFILESHRGLGLGKLLLQEITAHPQLQDLKWGLETKDAHGLYEQFGFRPLSAPQDMMRKPRSGSGAPADRHG
ncbi:GNAT family N-acetyltransferase [Compostibacter hankyongensis]|uniref:GNAT family N-acetyltransferase n=1 Tax=Compostibacter hankyongensis TaxID=1007089 RepID=UPI0031EB7EF3